jgi:predicted RNA binding protein YcfA (HicA-like mRNA interferase family)
MWLWELRRHYDCFSAVLPMRSSRSVFRFDDLCQLLESLGFEKRVRGSHHLFRKSGVEEKINLQRAGAQAKPYQVKQVRSVILKAKLGSRP